MDRRALAIAEKRLVEIQDSVGWGSDPNVSAQTFIRFCDLLRTVLWAVQRTDAEILEDAERQISRCESRIDELTEALRWCEGVFTNPRADEELRDGWKQYVAPLLPSDDGDEE